MRRTFNTLSNAGRSGIAGQWEKRKGVILVLVAIMLTIFLVFVAFSVDVSYMQLTRTQLRSGADAAAKAGSAELRLTQSPGQAISAAIDAASRNTVDGHPLRLTGNDIVLGQSVQQADGSWRFIAGQQPYRSVQINAALAQGTPNGPVNLFFAGLVGYGRFEPTRTSVASHLDQDVVLCLDRSHSMCWDTSGTSWQYPPYTGPHVSDMIQAPPNPTLSRWGSLVNAVTSFNNVVSTSTTPPRVGVVTWGSTIGTNTYEYMMTGQTAPAVINDCALAYNNSVAITSALNSHTNNVMLGGTDMNSGLSAAISMLQASNRPLAKKVVILMSDGQWNTGGDPSGAASTAQSNSITVHTIGFLRQTDQQKLIDIANLTGGKYYQASDAATLSQAFTDLAKTLSVVLTQ